MTLKSLCFTFAAATLIFSGVASAQNDPQMPAGAEVLTGDTRLACEAILCLSSSKKPPECDPALDHYYSIKKRKLSDTLRARHNFLKLCPVSDQSPEMSELVAALANGAGQCDAQTLNRTLTVPAGWANDSGGSGTVVSNQMPRYCSTLAGHAYTDLDGELPRYVGTPEDGGFWVEASDYDRALAEYERERARRNNNW